jgi:hypothetical protein
VLERNAHRCFLEWLVLVRTEGSTEPGSRGPSFAGAPASLGLVVSSFGGIVSLLSRRAGFPPPEGNPARRFRSFPLERQPNHRASALSFGDSPGPIGAVERGLAFIPPAPSFALCYFLFYGALQRR